MPSLIEGAPEAMIALCSTIALGLLETTWPTRRMSPVGHKQRSAAQLVSPVFLRERPLRRLRGSSAEGQELKCVVKLVGGNSLALRTCRLRYCGTRDVLCNTINQRPSRFSYILVVKAMKLTASPFLDFP